MPTRKVPIIPEEIYHIYNRSIARQPIFLTQKHYQRALEVIQFYQYSKPSIRFSYYNRLSVEQKNEFFLNLVKNNKKQIHIYTYCLMPNHFHFLLKEIEPNGISSFTGNIQNSYAKYFNIRRQRTGGLFQSMFKAVHIETDEQILHVMRYIHLNPLTSFVVKNIKGLEQYRWSSFLEYITEKPFIIEHKFIKSFFRSTEDFKKFIFNQTDYQKQLADIKHLTFE